MRHYSRILGGAMIGLSLAFALAGPPAWAHERHRHAAPTASPRAVEPPRPAVAECELLRRHLRRPEYWHILINPIPPLAMGAGAVLLLAALVHAAETAARGGLALIALGGAAFLPALLLGQKAYDRLFDGLPPEAKLWADIHMARAEKTQALFYLTAVVAIAAFAQAHRQKPGAKPLRHAALALGIGCAAVAAWIGHAGGQINHHELREGPPTPAALKIVPKDH